MYLTSIPCSCPPFRTSYPFFTFAFSFSVEGGVVRDEGKREAVGSDYLFFDFHVLVGSLGCKLIEFDFFHTPSHRRLYLSVSKGLRTKRMKWKVFVNEMQYIWTIPNAVVVSSVPNSSEEKIKQNPTIRPIFPGKNKESTRRKRRFLLILAHYTNIPGSTPESSHPEN